MNNFNHDLKLQIDTCEDTDEFNRICTNDNLNICKFCNGKYKASYITYIYSHKIETKSCYLCHIVQNFNNYYIKNIIIALSDLSQCDINNITLKYYNECDDIPIPTFVDKKIQLIEYPTLKLIESVSNFNNSKHSKHSKFFNKIKLFFTPNVLKSLKYYTYFNDPNKLNIDPYDLLFINNINYNNKIFIFNNKKLKIIKKYLYSTKNDKIVLKQLQNSINDKYKETTNFMSMLNSIS